LAPFIYHTAISGVAGCATRHQSVQNPTFAHDECCDVTRATNPDTESSRVRRAVARVCGFSTCAVPFYITNNLLLMIFHVQVSHILPPGLNARAQTGHAYIYHHRVKKSINHFDFSLGKFSHEFLTTVNIFVFTHGPHMDTQTRCSCF
jgi:hypothetical protein